MSHLSDAVIGQDSISSIAANRHVVAILVVSLAARMIGRERYLVYAAREGAVAIRLTLPRLVGFRFGDCAHAHRLPTRYRW